VRNYVKLAGKRNDVTQRTGTGGKRVSEFPDIQTLIRGYGLITDWSESRGQRYSLMGGTRREHTIKVALIYPINIPIPEENREVRTELYLQAESIIEVLKRERFQIINPPRIILGGSGEQIEGSIEVTFTT
jgi:hypothetical protein